MSSINEGGTTRLTADGSVGPSDKSIRVFNITIESSGTGGVGVLRNGTTASGDIYWQGTGTASTGVTFNFDNGRLFPNGCFYDHDSNTDAIIISYIAESAY